MNRVSPVKRPILAVAITAAMLMTSGCAQAPGTASIPRPTVEVPSDAELAELTTQSEARTLAFLLDQFPDATVPVVERERFIEPDEYAPVLAECLTEAGFPSVASADGGVSGSYQDADAEKRALVEYTCGTRFPMDPRYSAPLNDSQITYIYNYQTQILTRCLEEAGYVVDEPPALEEFLDSYVTDGGGWHPYEHVNAGDLTVSINVRCPQTPDHLYG